MTPVDWNGLVYFTCQKTVLRTLHVVSVVVVVRAAGFNAWDQSCLDGSLCKISNGTSFLLDFFCKRNPGQPSS